MEQFKSQGIITQVVPYRNYDAILTLFTPEEGLVTFFHKAAFSQKKGKSAAAPLSVAEIVHTRGRGEMHPCSEVCITDHHLALRNRLDILNTACEMLQSIMQTQQPGKSAPDLYALLLFYLKKLPSIPSPQTLGASFRLKLLRHEGLVAFVSHCNDCGALLSDAWIAQGEAYCRADAPAESLHLAQEERATVELLAFSRDLGQIANTIVTGQLAGKIERLFRDSL
jgi:DNA repair protein RecO (recombination protein O)